MGGPVTSLMLALYIFIAWWPWRTHQAPEATSEASFTHSLAITMIFHTGPTKPALVLLCCIGTLLATCGPSFGAPTANMIKTILELLKLESKELYEDYKKNSSGEVPIDESLQLPCFTLGCEASTSISIIQAYLEEVKRLSENRVNTSNVTKQLDDITCSDDVRCSNPPKPSISGPENFYERKSFKLTVLKRFSDCMENLQAKDRIC